MNQPQVTIPAFLPFYLHVVPRGAVVSRLGRLVAQVSPPAHAERVLDDVWGSLLTTVETHSFRALIGEFHAFRAARGMPMTTGSDEALQQFRVSLQDAVTCRRIADEYRVLEQRLAAVLGNSLDAYAELFTAYALDRPALTAAGLTGGDDDAIVGLFGTGSDLHNDNRQVVGVALVSGARVMFKPRSLASDDFVRDLFTAADPHLEFSLRDCLPRSVDRETHGWQQFVAPRPMSDPDQPGRYFYRFGALCALFGAIGASDLHDENLLASGEHPCVIDTETMMRPDAGGRADSLPGRLIDHLKLSVANTMLVPMADPTSRIDIVMAGVGVDMVQASSMRRPVIRDIGTDGISVRWENVTYQQKDNVPRLEAVAQSPLEHFAEIWAGYTAALAAVRDDALAKVLDRYASMPVRCLLRATMVYTRFLDAATHPDYLRDSEEAERVFRLLGSYPEYLSAGAVDYVGRVERAALHSGNVPYFVARAGSTELGTPRDRFPDVHALSALAFARRGLALNARQSDSYHHFLMEECLGELAGKSAEGMSRHSVFAPALAGARAGAWWPAIARTITDVGVCHEGPDGPETGWVCGIGPERGAPTVTPGNFISFHDNGGMVAFLRHAADHDAALEEASVRAERGLRTLMSEYGQLLAQAPEGAFTGAASLLITQPAAVDRAWMEQVLAGLRERIESASVATDLGNGPAGTAMLLLARAATGAPPLVDAAELTWLTDLVLEQLTSARTAPWFDVAHGDLGMRWAASRIGSVRGDDAVTAAAADWLLRRLAGDAPPAGTGWCNGAAGVLLAAVDMLAAAGRHDELSAGLLARLVDDATRLPDDGPLDISVCHGSSGVVQALLAVARIVGDGSLVDRAAAYQERVVSVIRTGGFHMGTTGRTSLLGYMFGWAGVGDTDLMLHEARTGRSHLGIPTAFLAPLSN